MKLSKKNTNQNPSVSATTTEVDNSTVIKITSESLSVDAQAAIAGEIGTGVPKRNSKSQLKRSVAPITVEYAKPPIDIEVEILPATVATPDNTGELTEPDPANTVNAKATGKVNEESNELSPEDANELAALETAIKDGLKSSTDGFQGTALALNRINEKKLYRGSYKSFEAYSVDKLGISRAHAYRFVEAGKIINRVSPAGDVIKAFGSESHFRPLSGLTEVQEDAVISRVEKWVKITGLTTVTPKMVAAAVQIEAYVPNPNAVGKKSKRMETLEKCVNELKAKLDGNLAEKLMPEFSALEKAIVGTVPKTGITWTEATWNTIHGCTPFSPGCYRCYAARNYGTRFMHRCPGMTERRKLGGSEVHAFNGTIRFDCESMGSPLMDRVPKRYFVNSWSELFHEKVPDAFVDEVFEVMEKAHWHIFQVLTKRTKRMAEYLAKRYGENQVPGHIWIGTTIEDQKRLDERLPILLKINAAVRWVSIEPLLEALKVPKVQWHPLGDRRW